MLILFYLQKELRFKNNLDLSVNSEWFSTWFTAYFLATFLFNSSYFIPWEVGFHLKWKCW
jgi:hypothetical protein